MRILNSILKLLLVLSVERNWRVNEKLKEIESMKSDLSYAFMNKNAVFEIVSPTKKK